MPKYSIVLPTLNGRETLAITLPAMLGKIRRPDVEWIVSDNRSEDGGYDWLLKLSANDQRLRVVRPAHRLCIGEHLEFVYRFAKGDWLCHLGDDDLLLPDRFEILDRVSEQTGADIVCGRFLRYIWPRYPDASVANSFDPQPPCTRDVSLLTGVELARRLLNEKVVTAGGCWSVRREIADQVRQRAGWFSSPQHLEFFAMRSAAGLSRRAAIVDSPLMILGRHEKSSGSLAYLPKTLLGSRHWDWSIEDPQPYRYSPFPWKAYCTLSLDAALSVKEIFPERLAGVKIDWPHWTDLIFREAAELVRIGQLPRSVMREFLQVVAKVPGASPLYWRWRWARKQLQRPWRSVKDLTRPWRHAATAKSSAGRVYGAKAGFADIAEAAQWFSANQAGIDRRARAA